MIQDDVKVKGSSAVDNGLTPTGVYNTLKAAQRTRQPSNAVNKALLVGTPASAFAGYIGMILATKYGIPPDVTGAVIGLLGQGIAALIAWLSLGGRKGEAN